MTQDFISQHGEGGLTLEVECDLQQYEKKHRKNDSTPEEYCSANGGQHLFDSEDLNDNSGLQ